MAITLPFCKILYCTFFIIEKPFKEVRAGNRIARTQSARMSTKSHFFPPFASAFLKGILISCENSPARNSLKIYLLLSVCGNVTFPVCHIRVLLMTSLWRLFPNQSTTKVCRFQMFFFFPTII